MEALTPREKRVIAMWASKYEQTCLRHGCGWNSHNEYLPHPICISQNEKRSQTTISCGIIINLPVRYTMIRGNAHPFSIFEGCPYCFTELQKLGGWNKYGVMSLDVRFQQFWHWQ